MNSKRTLLVIILIMVLIVSGCSLIDKRDAIQKNEKLEAQQDVAQEDSLIVNPECKKSEEKEITLYFKHYYNDFLVQEKRTVTEQKSSDELLIMEELLKGPSDKHQKVSLLGAFTILDVSKRGETVFLDLSSEFLNKIDLTLVPGKETVSEDKVESVQSAMKRLSIYSIVNSLTEIDGVNQVKFMVENELLTYDMLGENVLIAANTNIEGDAPVTPLTRNKSYNQSPSKVVSAVFQGLIGEPDWERIYSMLAEETMDGNKLPPIEELKSRYSAYVTSLELTDDFIVDEEIKSDGNAFVNVKYIVRYTNGTKETREYDSITVVPENGVWKVKLPRFVNGLGE